MLGDHTPLATLAVRDLAAAIRFYRDTVGLALERSAPDMGVATFRSGGGTLLVYQSEHAGTNRATGATWGVGDDFEATIGALRARGVVFERYDLPGMTENEGIHVAGGFRAAWFRDPDGNILHVNSA